MKARRTLCAEPCRLLRGFLVCHELRLLVTGVSAFERSVDECLASVEHVDCSMHWRCDARRGFLSLSCLGMMLALPTVVWAGVLFAIVVYLGTMFLSLDLQGCFMRDHVCLTGLKISGQSPACLSCLLILFYRFTVILLGNIPELEVYFGRIGLALWTHFVIVTMETWPDIADSVLAVANPLWGVYFVVPHLLCACLRKGKLLSAV